MTEAPGIEKHPVNPWTWQDAAGFSQAWRVEGGRTIVFVSGQTAISAEGVVVGVEDFEAQVRQTLENLRTVLEAAGARIDDVVKVTVFLTDMDRLREYTRIKNEYFAGAHAASSAIGVTGLARPELMVEVEAIAVL